MTRTTCIGYFTGPKPEDHVACADPVEPGEDFCASCGRIMYHKFRKAWGDIAQKEKPEADPGEIQAGINAVLGQVAPRIFILMVGIPGSGKTWLLERLVPQAHIVRPDDHIGYTADRPWTPRAAKSAWKTARAELKNAFGMGAETVALDATMVVSVSRQKYIKMARKAGFLPVAVCVETDPLVCEARNSERDTFRKVPDGTMASMRRRLERPEIDEGFSAVVRCRLGNDQPFEVEAPDGDEGTAAAEEAKAWIESFTGSHGMERE